MYIFYVNITEYNIYYEIFVIIPYHLRNDRATNI